MTSLLLRTLRLSCAVSLASAASTIPVWAQPAPAVPTELVSEQLEMTSTDDETTAIATGNVILTGTNLRITCDRLVAITIRLDSQENKGDTIPAQQKFKYILATGNVRIVQGDRESTSQRAEVFPREDKVVLTEDPVIIDHSNGFVAAGEKITLFRGKREVFVEKPKFTGPPIQDLSATASPTNNASSAAKPAPAPQSPPTVTFPNPGTTTR
jgi:Organic solvent tolerance protein OstA